MKLIELKFDPPVDWEFLKSLDLDERILIASGSATHVFTCKVFDDFFDELWLRLDNNKIKFEVTESV